MFGVSGFLGEEFIGRLGGVELGLDQRHGFLEI